jgi:selenocysteine lyase/cysteine desulfurase
MNVEGKASGQIVKALAERGIRVTSRISDYYSRHTLMALGIEECVRVSLAHYNTPEEVDIFLKAMGELAR